MNTDLYNAIKCKFDKKFDEFDEDDISIYIGNHSWFKINVVDDDGSSYCSCFIKAELNFDSKTGEIKPDMTTEDYILLNTYYDMDYMYHDLKPESVDFDMLVECEDSDFDEFTEDSEMSDFDEDDIEAAKEDYSDRYNLDNYDKACTEWIKEHTYKDIDISVFFHKLADVINDVTNSKDHSSSDAVEDFASFCYEIDRFIANYDNE